MKIWKQTIPAKGRFEVQWPYKAKVLHVALQDAEPQIWFQFDEANMANLETRMFQVIATGQPFGEDLGSSERLEYHGTFLLEEGSLVFHLFEEISL